MFRLGRARSSSTSPHSHAANTDHARGSRSPTKTIQETVGALQPTRTSLRGGEQRLPLLANQRVPIYPSHRTAVVSAGVSSSSVPKSEVEATSMAIRTEDALLRAEEGGDAPTPPTPRQKLSKMLLGLGLAAIVLYVILDYTVPGLGYVADILKSFLEWVEENPGLGAVAFAGVYIFTTVSFIPGSLLTLGAGLVFGRALGTGLGVLVGSIAVLVGATIGAILAFLLGRFVFKEQAQGLFNKFKILKAVDKAIETQGLKLVLLLRLSPVVPFSAFNYVMGVTAVHFWDYAIGCLGFIPGTVAYVFIGTTASSLLGDEDDDAGDDDDGSSARVQLVVLIVGAIATVVAVVLISIYSKRALNKVLEEGEEGRQGEERQKAGAASIEEG